MGDGASGTEDWGGYLKRMTSRPGWSVARLAREANIHRGTIFKWMKGESGVTVASVRAIADALGEDPANALRAAGSVASTVEQRDPEIDLVLSDDSLDEAKKRQLIELILDRRKRDMEGTRRMIGLFKGERSA